MGSAQSQVLASPAQLRSFPFIKQALCAQPKGQADLWRRAERGPWGLGISPISMFSFSSEKRKPQWRSAIRFLTEFFPLPLWLLVSACRDMIGSPHHARYGRSIPNFFPPRRVTSARWLPCWPRDTARMLWPHARRSVVEELRLAIPAPRRCWGRAGRRVWLRLGAYRYLSSFFVATD